MWTLGDTLQAADAAVIVLHDDSIGSLEGSADRAGPDARRVVAVHAGPRHVVLTGSWIVGHFIDLDPLLHRWYVVHFVACLGAISAAVALGEIDYHYPSLVGGRLRPPRQRASKDVLGCELPDTPASNRSRGAACDKAEQSATRQCHNNLLIVVPHPIW